MHSENNFPNENGARAESLEKAKESAEGAQNGHITAHSNKISDSEGLKTDNLNLDNDIATLREKIKAGTELAKKLSENQVSSSGKAVADLTKGSKKVKKQSIDKQILVFDNNDLPAFGHFLWDKPKNITDLEYNSLTNDLEAYVHWEPRADGTTPYPTKMARIDILKYDPVFLALHYEKSLTISHLPSVNFQNLRKFE